MDGATYIAYVQWGAKLFLVVGLSYITDGNPSGASGVLLYSNGTFSALYAEMVGYRLHVPSIFIVISICGMYWHHSWSGLLLATVAKLEIR